MKNLKRIAGLTLAASFLGASAMAAPVNQMAAHETAIGANTKGAYVRLGQNKSLSVSMITESIMASLEKYTLSDAKRVETDAPNNYIIALVIATGILLFVIWRLKV